MISAAATHFFACFLDFLALFLAPRQRCFNIFSCLYVFDTRH
jgi:hypothetical protein